MWLALANGNRKCNISWICFPHGLRKSSLASREAMWGRTQVSWREGYWLVACEWCSMAQLRCQLTAMSLEEASRRTIQLPALFLTTEFWASKCCLFQTTKVHGHLLIANATINYIFKNTWNSSLSFPPEVVTSFFFFFLFHVQSYSFFFSTNTFSRVLGCYEIMFSLKKGNCIL